MADMLSALNWLNQQSPSEIQQMSRFWINHIQESDLTEEEKKDIILSLASSIRTIGDTHEKAEILANCGAYGFQLGVHQDSLIWLDQAEKLYIDDIHRQAVTNWMQYIVHRADRRFQRAVNQAQRALRLFSDLADQSVTRKQHELEGWYRGRLIDMTCDLIDAPEVVFELLFVIPGTFFNPSSAQIKAKLVEALEKGDTEKVFDDMQLLMGVSSKTSLPEETGEALGFCGVIHWVLDNQVEATQFFRSAMTQFNPGSHPYVMLRWMLGLALFSRTPEHYEAISQMESSINEIDSLRKKAVQKNQNDEANQYAAYQLAMRRVLRNQINNQV